MGGTLKRSFSKSAGVSLVEVMIGLGIGAFLLTVSIYTLMRHIRESAYLEARGLSESESLLFIREVENYFTKQRTDEPFRALANPPYCPRPVLNFLRLGNPVVTDTPPTSAADCGGMGYLPGPGLRYTPLLNADPATTTRGVGGQYEEGRGTKFVIENITAETPARVVRRVEYDAQCVTFAPMGHPYNAGLYSWDFVHPTLMAEGCPAVQGGVNCGSVGNLNNGAGLAVMKSQWNDWEAGGVDRDWIGGNAVPVPDSVTCMPQELFTYNAGLRRCQFRMPSEVIGLDRAPIGMTFCAWSPDIVAGLELNLRLWVFYEGMDGEVRALKTEQRLTRPDSFEVVE